MRGAYKHSCLHQAAGALRAEIGLPLSFMLRGQPLSGPISISPDLRIVSPQLRRCAAPGPCDGGCWT